MTWFKVDDGIFMHPKAIEAGLEAMGLWMFCGAWSSSHLTDGFIPKSVVKPLGSRPKLIEKLVESGLWTVVDGGWQFHDWHKYNPSKKEVELEREEAAERMRQARKGAKEAREASKRSPEQPLNVPPTVRPNNARTFGVTSPEVRLPRPDPTRPEVLKNTSGGADGAAAPSDAPGVQPLIAAWIDRCDQRPPRRVIGQISREVKLLLAENIPPADVAAGLQRLHERGLHPSTLASCVHETRQRPAATGTTTNSRVAAALDLAAELRRRENLSIVPEVGA